MWFSQDGLSRTFPHGRVVYKHKFVELPLILRGHSLGQPKFFGSLFQLGLLMSLAMFHLVVVFLESKHHAISNETLMVDNVFHCRISPRLALSSPKFSTFRQHLPNIGYKISYHSMVQALQRHLSYRYVTLDLPFLLARVNDMSRSSWGPIHVALNHYLVFRLVNLV